MKTITIPRHFTMITRGADAGDQTVTIDFPESGHKWVAEYRDGLLVGCDGDETAPDGVLWRDLLEIAELALMGLEEDEEDAEDRREAEWY